MNVWLYYGPRRLKALTREQDGSNLPDDLGPWERVRSVSLHEDAPDEQEAMVLIAEHGFCCFE